MAFPDKPVAQLLGSNGNSQPFISRVLPMFFIT